MSRFRCLFVMVSIAVSAGWTQAQTVGTSSGSAEVKSKKAAISKQKSKKVAEEAQFKPVAAGSDLPADLQVIADQIHTGKLPCELGQTVTLLHDAHELGRFNLFLKNHVYHLTPVQSVTGALRLEDSAKGAVWIQLADKSMLMNSQLGQRMADMCQSHNQMQVAAANKLAPPPSLLEPMPGNGLAQK